MKIKGERKLGTESAISVSDYINFLNEILKRVDARIVGEISSFQIAASGHVYFSIKDKNKSATLKCVMWKYNYQMCGVKLKEGLEVIVSGNSDIYLNTGNLNFKVETIELVGEGALKKAYDELKNKLEKEGLFNFETKRKIPEYPTKIGVITSLKSGTVIHDFTSNLGKYGFEIKAMDSRVEGQEAVKDLIKSVKSFKKEKIDVLVVIRGGGSLESLMAFDNELLVREIKSFPVPVIAGIGHHKDITLVSLAADACESTPSAVAYLLNRNYDKLTEKFDFFEKEIIRLYDYKIKQSNIFLDKIIGNIIFSFNLIVKKFEKNKNKLMGNLIRIENEITNEKNFLFKAKKQIFYFFEYSKDKKIKEITSLEKLINSNNPEKQLNLGYSIVRVNGEIIKTIKKIKEKDKLEIQLNDGLMESIVKKIKNKK